MHRAGCKERGRCLEGRAVSCCSTAAAADQAAHAASPTAHLVLQALVWSARREGRSAGAPASTAPRVPRRAACGPGSPLHSEPEDATVRDP